MEKVLMIEGKPIKMKSDGGTARMYRQYFKRDFIIELGFSENKKNIDPEVVENLAWTLAKRADDSIPDIDEWLCQFESPLSIINKTRDIISIITSSTQSVVKPKKTKNQRRR